MTDEEKKSIGIEILDTWRKDPIARHKAFSNDRLWSKQVEILESVRNNKRTVVKSGNTVGKTKTASEVVLDWMITRGPQAKVITTAPSFHQVETILWREIRQACFKSKIPLGVEPLQTELKFSDEWFALGISTDKPVNFQGKHSPNLLVVIDEASGISPEIWDMVEALHPTAILAIGNPLEASGRFAECFTSDLWNKITISCNDCVDWQRKNGAIPGLVTLEWINEMHDMHGVKSPWYRTHVLGEFPEEDEQALIQKAWVDRARKGLDADGYELDEEHEGSKTRIVGCDVATKHGSNLTVIGYRYGHTVKSLTGYPRSTMTNTRDRIKDFYTKHEVNEMVSDADGVGESLAEILGEVYVPCNEFHGGSGAKAMDSVKFRNLRSQFYFVIAKKFEKGLYNLKHLDDATFEILRGQLCSIRVKAPDPMGRFQIETKEEMIARQIKSPDYADTFMMMEYGYFIHRQAEVKPYAYGGL